MVPSAKAGPKAPTGVGSVTRRVLITFPVIINSLKQTGEFPSRIIAGDESGRARRGFWSQDGELSLAPDFSPVSGASEHREAVSTAFPRKANPLKRVLSAGIRVPPG